jgi:hypothetical protein
LFLLFSSGLPSTSFARDLGGSQVNIACGCKVFRTDLIGNANFTAAELKRGIHCDEPSPWLDTKSGGLNTNAGADAMEALFSANGLTGAAEGFFYANALADATEAFFYANALADATAAFFYDNGFLNVEVDEPQIGPSDQLMIGINEGPRYRLGPITIEGPIVFPRGVLESRLKMKRGEPFRASGLQRDVLALSDFYSDRGYAFVNVDPRIKMDSLRHLTNVSYEITPGHLVRIGRIIVSGNSATSDNLIRRTLKIREHQLYSAKAFHESKAQLDELGIFDETRITTTPSAKSNEIDVKVMVVEKPSPKISLLDTSVFV